MPSDHGQVVNANSKAKVFISYARRDLTFVDRLDAALKARGIEALIDRTEIYAFEDWWKRIEALIAQADTIVFVLSPDAVRPESVCLKEVTFAQSLNKRFAPIVCQDVANDAVPETLRRLNWIFFDDTTQFEVNADRLAEALSSDIDWIRKHTEFGTQARRWSLVGRPGPRGLLLRSPVLEEAERWIAARPEGAPMPTEETQALIAESRRAATRRRNIVTGGLAAGLLLATGLAGLAYWQREIAVEQRMTAIEQRNRAQIAQSRLIADVATREAEAGDVLTAMLLALDGLPDARGGVDRPYVPEAELALFNSRQRLREITVLKGHERFLTGATFSPDGSRVVTASNDATARLWDAITGEEIAALKGHEAPVWTAVFSSDGRRIMTASQDQTARLWDAASGKEIAVLRDTEKLASAALSPDGRLAITTSRTPVARLWDVETGKEIGVFDIGIPVLSAQFSPDGRHVIFGVNNRTAQIWDVASRTEVALFFGLTEPVVNAAFSPDGQRVVTASLDGPRIWDVESRKELTVFKGHSGFHVHSAEFSPDGRYVLTAADDWTARIWDAASGAEVAVLRGHRDGVISAAFSREGRRVVTASFDLSARIWDAEPGDRNRNVLPPAPGSNVIGAAFNRDGSRAIALSSEIFRKNTVVVLEAETGQQLGGFEVHGDIETSELSPESRYIVSSPRDRSGTQLRNAETGETISVLADHADRVWRARFSRDGRLVVTASDDKTARVWNVATGELIALLSGHDHSVTSAALSPDSRHVVTTSNDVRLWDVVTSTQVGILGMDATSHGPAVFSPDGRTILTTSNDGTVRLWDVATRSQVHAIKVVDTTNVNTNFYIPVATFSPDGRQILIAYTGDNYAQIWDAQTGQLIRVLAWHGRVVTRATFSPDGRRVVTASADGTSRLWDAATGQSIGILPAHPGYGSGEVYSRDGRRLLTWSSDGSGQKVRLWQVFADTQELVDATKRVVPRCLTPSQRQQAHIDPEPPA
jgi:WD40 repeat protein